MTAQTDHAVTAAVDIVHRAAKRAGALWGRLSGDGQLVECKAVLCDDMLRDRSGSGLEWWLAVQRAVLNLVIPE